MATRGTLTTPAIDGRSLTFEWQRTSVDNVNNTSTISYTLTGSGSNTSEWVYVSPVTLTVNGQQVYAIPSEPRQKVYSGTVLKSGTMTIPHNQDGTKTFAVRIVAGIYSFATSTTDGTFILDSIPRSSTIRANKTSVELGDSVTFTITANSPAERHTIQVGVNNQLSWTDIATDVYQTQSWTLPTSWAQYFPNGEQLRVRVLTYSGGTYLGSYEMSPLAVTAPQSMAPSVTLTCTDPTGNLATYGGYVQLQSTIHAEAQQTFHAGTTGKKQVFTIDGQTYIATGATPAVTSEPITQDTQTVTYAVTDGRNLTTTASETLTVLPWHIPTISAYSVQRCNQDGTLNEDGSYGKVEFTYDISPLNDRNSKQAVISYAQSGTPATQSVTLNTYSGTASAIIPMSADYAWTVTLTLTDDFSSSSAEARIGTGFTLVDYHNSGRGISFGKVAETADLLDCNLSAQFRKSLKTGDANDNNVAELAPFTQGFVSDWLTRLSASDLTLEAILAYLEANAIVQEGQSGIWNYAIRGNGDCELWARNVYTGIDIDRPWGSWYYQLLSNPPDYPVTFTAYPSVAITMHSTAGRGVGAYNNSDYTLTNAGGLFVYAPRTEVAVNMTVNYYVRGKVSPLRGGRFAVRKEKPINFGNPDDERR